MLRCACQGVRARAMALHWRGRCGAPTPLRCSVGRPASRNSLRSLRSLRSDSRDESVDDSRCALVRPPCASRRPRGAPPPGPARLGNRVRWMLGTIQKNSLAPAESSVRTAQGRHLASPNENRRQIKDSSKAGHKHGFHSCVECLPFRGALQFTPGE